MSESGHHEPTPRQDTMNRHLELMGPDTRVIFNSDTIKAAEAGQGAQLCPMPVKQLTNNSKNKLAHPSR